MSNKVLKVTWMDASIPEASYHAGSTQILNGVLHIYPESIGADASAEVKHIPLTSMRVWTSADA